MLKLRTIIADDADGFNENLAKQIADNCPNVEIIGMASTLEQTQELILTLQPDLVILDVDFGGPNSFDMLEQLALLGKLNFQIVFLTSYLEGDYIIKAFKYSALQYFTKPIDNQLLIDVMNKAMEVQQEKLLSQTPRQLKVMMQNLKKPNLTPESPILIKQLKKNFVQVLLKEIVYIHSAEGKADICLLDGRSIKSVNSVGDYEEMNLGRQFLRIHQSIIVNMDHFTGYHSPTRSITLLDDVTLTASKQGDKEIRKFLSLL